MPSIASNVPCCTNTMTMMMLSKNDKTTPTLSKSTTTTIPPMFNNNSFTSTASSSFSNSSSLSTTTSSSSSSSSLNLYSFSKCNEAQFQYSKESLNPLLVYCDEKKRMDYNYRGESEWNVLSSERSILKRNCSIMGCHRLAKVDNKCLSHKAMMSNGAKTWTKEYYSFPRNGIQQQPPDDQTTLSNPPTTADTPTKITIKPSCRLKNEYSESEHIATTTTTTTTTATTTTFCMKNREPESAIPLVARPCRKPTSDHLYSTPTLAHSTRNFIKPELAISTTTTTTRKLVAPISSYSLQCNSPIHLKHPKKLSMNESSTPKLSPLHASPRKECTLLSRKNEQDPVQLLCKHGKCDEISIDGNYCLSHGNCTYMNCEKRVISGRYCKSHGGARKCRFEKCIKTAQSKGYCIAHGGGTRCKFGYCVKLAIRRGLCIEHGGGRKCGVEHCDKHAKTGGFCIAHGGGSRCKIEGCQKGAQVSGRCAAHGGARSQK